MDVPPDELAHRLTMAGLEVEGLEHGLPCLERVIAARIVSVKPHHNKDGVYICSVDTGGETCQVVCGAPNVKEGMLTALALPGAELPGGSVKETTVYGEASQGMLCSEAELLLGEDASGIMELEGGEPGAPLAKAMDMKEWVLEIGITPNRSDCLSILGVAREAAALLHKPLKSTDNKNYGFGQDGFQVEIKAPELCRRYCAAVVRGVAVGPSPLWLRQRLHAAGIRSINNIVDATNYVMLELGQPLHAFDLDTLRGPRIVVRTAKEGEEITTLDGKRRALSASMLVIADNERPVAVAGVMGGAETEVTEGTVNILLESAWFTPSQIRRTAKALKLPTDASYRFERGIDPEMTPLALARVVQLIEELAGGRAEYPWTDAYPLPHKARRVAARTRRISRLLGMDVAPGEARSIFESLGFRPLSVEDDLMELEVPSWRWDVEEEIDLVEEVARIKGFDTIPSTVPKAACWEKGPENDSEFQSKVKRLLASFGMDEAISYSFLSPRDIACLALPDSDPRGRFVKIKNPLTEEQSVMRTHLLPSLLGAVQRNISRRNIGLRLFEMGKVFLEQDSGGLPLEETRVAGVVTGPRFATSWAWPDQDSDLFDLKGVVEGLLQRLGAEEAGFELGTPNDPYYLPGSSVRITVSGEEVGTLGAVAPAVLKHWDIDQEVFAFDLSLERLAKIYRPVPRFVPLPEFPAIERDAALVMDDSVLAGDVVSYIRENKTEYLEEFTIFDIYRGKPIPKGRKSMAIRFRYRALDRTLTDEEIAPLHEALVGLLIKRFNAELRS